jgi:HEPN domain-containing protein
MQEHEKWLFIAREDLGIAKLAISAEYFSSATYHCQQCAEKALKGYLCFRGESITKTHDLIKALEQCMQFDPNFKQLYQEARELTPFSTKFRYPTEFDIPDFTKVTRAIKQAEAIINFVSKKIADPKSNQITIK